MEIKITQRFGQIGIDTNQARVSVETRPAVINTTTTPPEVDYSIDFPRVRIDSAKPLAEIGYKAIVPFAADYAQRGKSAVLGAIGRLAREGDSYAASAGQKTVVAAQIAKSKSFDNTNFNIGLVPRSSPEISVSGGLDIKARQGEVHSKAAPNLPEIRYSQGSIKVYLRQTPMIKVESVGSRFDLVI